MEVPGRRSGTDAVMCLPLPMVGTSIAFDVFLFLAAWPLWWWCGVEQLLPPMFALWQLGRCAVYRGASLALGFSELTAVALAVWSMVPVMWVGRGEMDLFAKEVVTFWTQAIVLIVLRNAVRDAASWRRVLSGLRTLGVIVATGGLVYATGLWRGSITSLVGMVLPERQIASSEFLTSISIRSLGAESVGGLLDDRAWSFALRPSSASMVCLVLIPISVWSGWRGSGWRRVVSWIAASGLLVTLLMTQSRAGWAAFVAGTLVAAMLVAVRTSHTSLRVLVVSGAACVGIVFAATTGPSAVDAMHRVVTEIRPESWRTRLELYRETIEMFAEHPIAGWGHAVERVDRRRVFSAGTHSAPLGMLFQHGIVGLVLYVALWVSIWRVIIRNLLPSLRSGSRSGEFWIVATVAMFAFNLRETVDNWWWDQLVTIVVWCFWGLVLTGPSVVARPMAPRGGMGGVGSGT